MTLRHAIVASLLVASSSACDPERPAPPPAASAPAAASSAAMPSSAPAASGAALERRARALAKKLLIVDGHVDLPHRLHTGRDPKTGKLTEDPSRRTDEGDFDYPRAVEGGLDAPFMSIYIPADLQKTGGAKALADELIDMVEGLVERAPDRFAPGRSVGEVRRAFREKKIALPMGIENGAALEGKLENVAHFHRRGVRYITLTHSKDNDICDSSYDTARTHRGLSAFGRAVVQEMNRVGIMIDVSHISDDAFEQVIELSRTPVIASHSSCRHFTPGFERNMSDAMIEKLARRRGVIMINFGSGFVDHDVRKAHDTLRQARQLFMEKNGLAREHPEVNVFVDRYKAEHRVPRATVQQVAEHVLHVVELVGVDHVGLGSDFDGVGDSLPEGLRDASEIPNLLRVLLERGLSEDDLRKIGSENVLRVWEAVEKHAAKQAASTR